MNRFWKVLNVPSKLCILYYRIGSFPLSYSVMGYTSYMKTDRFKKKKKVQIIHVKEQ